MIKGYIFTYLYLFILILIVSILNKKTKINTKITRKIIHIGVSFCYVIFAKYFNMSYHMIVPPTTFVFINYISYKKDLFKAMEGENKSLGTVYYAISVLVLCVISYFKKDFFPFFGIGLFIMAFSDGLAPFISKIYKTKIIMNNKTILGSISVFAISIIVALIFSLIYSINYNILGLLLIGVISSILELLGTNGKDNIYLPIGISLIAYILRGI